MSLKEKKVLRQNRKNELSFLTHIFCAILTDCTRDFPTISRRDLKRDLNTILFLLEHRGVWVYTQLLPKLDDILLFVLAGGQASFSNPFGFGHTPKLFRGLWRLVIDDDGYLQADADPTSIFYIRQIALFAKKANITLTSTKRAQEKINGYESIEESLYSPSKRWFMDDFHGSNADDSNSCSLSDYSTPELFSSESDCILSQGLSTIQKTGDYFAKHLDFISRWFFRSVESNSGYVKRKRSLPFKHGPGATATTSRYIDKYKLRTIMPSTLAYFNQNPQLCFLQDMAEYSNVKVAEEQSRIVLVPKDSRGPRVIAAEPIFNQFLQQGGYRFIKNYVIPNTCLRNSINFSNQGLSKLAAKEASISGSYSTIDLSDASDRLSLFLIERLFSGSQPFLQFLHACRTKSTRYENRSFNYLKKFASQGNALTFPLQTMVYTIICYGTLLEHFKLEPNSSNLEYVSKQVRVFGDDIIVPNFVVEKVVDYLHLFQLKVNLSKSFSTGFFRESCGGDYYKGYCVTPLKIRVVDYSSPQGQQMLLDVSNEAFSKGLWRTANVLTKFFNNRDFVPIIAVTDEGVGLKCYSGRFSRHLPKRWVPEWYTIQHKVWISYTRNWKCNRPFSSRIMELNVVDRSQDGWQPGSILRSSSSCKLSWM